MRKSKARLFGTSWSAMSQTDGPYVSSLRAPLKLWAADGADNTENWDELKAAHGIHDKYICRTPRSPIACLCNQGLFQKYDKYWGFDISFQRYRLRYNLKLLTDMSVIFLLAIEVHAIRASESESEL